MLKAICRVTIFAATVLPICGELPDYYKSVDRMIWVTGDLDATRAGLSKIGFTNVSEPVEESLAGEFRGRPITDRVKVAAGRFGDVAVHWLQPLGGDNAFTEFLAKHGSGVFSLVHRVPAAGGYDGEIERLAGLGVGTLQSGEVDGVRYAFLDTESQGKYVLGLIHFPGGDDGPLAVPPGNPSGRKVTQFAFAVRYLMPVSLYWEKLGFPAMAVTHGTLRELRYRGEPGRFDMKLGWQRHGKVDYEWIQSIEGPDIYLEHMDKHGEGFHHLAFQVKDMEQDLEWWAERGYPESMSGAWGAKDKPGSGRFAYVDTQSIGGTDVELLWNYQK